MDIKKPQDQELFFDNGTRRTILGVVKTAQGNWWHLTTKDNTEFIVNPNKILMVKINKK